MLDVVHPLGQGVDRAHEQLVGRGDDLPDVAEEEQPDDGQADPGQPGLPATTNRGVGATHLVRVLKVNILGRKEREKERQLWAKIFFF